MAENIYTDDSIIRKYDDETEYTVSVESGFVTVSTPHLDKPLKICLTMCNELAKEEAEETSTAYFL